MEIRTRLTVRRPTLPGPLLAAGLLLFTALAYGPPAAWLVLARSPAAVELACGPGRTADLVAPSLVDPADRRSRPLRFACRDAAGDLVPDPGAHDRIAHAGRAGLLAALVALVLAARPVLRALFGRRPGGSSRAGAAWLGLPEAARRRIAALAFALPVGFCLAVVPVAVTAQSLHLLPGAGALLCESGRIAEHGYRGSPALTSSRSARMIGCLDRDGQVVPDDRLHERAMRWIILAFWLPLAGLLYPLGLRLRWRSTGTRATGTLRERA